MSSPAIARTDTPPEWVSERAEFLARIAQLEHQLAWFQRQLVGAKSERRHLAPPPEQMALGEGLGDVAAGVEPTQPLAAHQRRRAAATKADGEEPALFFDPARVPVETLVVPNPEIAGLPASAYEVIGERVTHRLAQRPGSSVVLKYVRTLVKVKDTAALSCPPAPAGVLEGGRADASFLAGLVIDQFLYHLVLYRQHQRLLGAGIEVSRQWLTQQVLAVAFLLAPLVAAQLVAIRACRVKAMDETPIKAGRNGKGQMKTGWFWPIWGDTDDGGGGDIVFLFRASRAAIHVREGRGDRQSNDTVLLTDGDGAYAHYAARFGLAMPSAGPTPEAPSSGPRTRSPWQWPRHWSASAPSTASRPRSASRAGAARGPRRLPRRPRSAHRHQPLGAGAAPNPHGPQELAVLLERDRRRGGGHPPAPDRHLSPAAHRPPPRPRGPPPDPAAVEAALRR